MNLGPHLQDDPNGAILRPGVVETKASALAALINTPTLRALLIATAVAATGSLYFGAFHPDRFGFYRDDSMYAVMGKALAAGQGYRIISLPDEPVQAKSPPFYPFLLSVIWRLKPVFPQNLTAMMLMTAGFAIIFFWLTYRYLLKLGYASKWQVMVVVGLAAVNWRTIVLASGIYSEMVYAALSVAALYLAEKYDKSRNDWALGSATGVVTGLAFLTRSTGVALLIAMALYFLLRRRWNGLLPFTIAGMIVLVWLGWGFLNGATTDNANAGSYESYFQTFRALIVQDGQSTFAALLTVIARNALGLILISIPVVCLGLAYESVFYFGFAFLFIAGGFWRQIRSGFRLMHIYVVIYLSVHLVWPYTSYDRFLMPLLPFLLLFIVVEIQAIFALIRKVLSTQKQMVGRVSAVFIGLTLVILLGAFLYNYGLGVYRSLSLATIGKVPQPASDDAEAIEWIKSHTVPSDVLICYRDPLYFLYTSRRAARSSSSREGGSLRSSEASGDEHAQEVLRIIEENKGRYLVLTSSDFDLEYQPESRRERLRALVDQNPNVFVRLFESSSGRSKIYRIENVGG